MAAPPFCTSKPNSLQSHSLSPSNSTSFSIAATTAAATPNFNTTSANSGSGSVCSSIVRCFPAVKLRFVHLEEWRRFSMLPPYTFSSLLQLLFSQYRHNLPQHFRLYYIDEDDEQIDIFTDEELHDALQSAGHIKDPDKLAVIKLYVEPISTNPKNGQRRLSHSICRLLDLQQCVSISQQKDNDLVCDVSEESDWEDVVLALQDDEIGVTRLSKRSSKSSSDEQNLAVSSAQKNLQNTIATADSVTASPLLTTASSAASLPSSTSSSLPSLIAQPPVSETTDLTRRSDKSCMCTLCNCRTMTVIDTDHHINRLCQRLKQLLPTLFDIPHSQAAVQQTDYIDACTHAKDWNVIFEKTACAFAQDLSEMTQRITVHKEK